VLQVLNASPELKILRNGNRWELIQDEPDESDDELDYDL
jgi:hypothetical protein